MNEKHRGFVEQALVEMQKEVDEHGARFPMLGAMNNLRQLLEQPEPVQEPVAWMDPTDGAIIKAYVFKDDPPLKGWRPLGFIDTPPAAAQPEPDMYWDDDDSERSASDSIPELLYERWNNGDLEVGYEVSMTCAKQMEPLTVRVTKLDEDADDIEYEVVKKGTT
jgi:hypothetical protein